MKKCLFYIMSAAILFSCSKESVNVAPEQESNALIYKTFTASSDDTKTYLDGMSVKWAAGDKINVVAYGTGNQYTFTLKSGENTSSAVFEGSIAAADAEETQFIAVYPDVNVAINKDADPTKEIIEYLAATSGGHVKYFDSDGTPVKAIKGGFDSRYAPMTAVLSGDNFAFRHGAAYFKLRMSEDGVKTVKLAVPEEGGGARFNGRPKYYLSTGLTSAVESAQKYIYASPEVGTFEKNAVYYIPVLTKQSNTGDLTITYTKEDGTTSSSVKTSVLSSKKLTAGLIYDLGTPPVTFSPFIKADDMTINADATGGNITFTVYNPVAVGEVTATATGGSIGDFSLGAVGDGIIPFYCDPNSGDEKKAYVTITYTYNDSETVTKDVVITQKAAGAKEAHSWNFVDYSDAEMESITGRAANVAASAGAVWNFGDGLTMTTNGSSKWDNQTIDAVSYKYVATGGKYGSSQKYFQFTTGASGTVTVLYASGKNDTPRSLSIDVNGVVTTDSSHVSNGTADLRTVTFTSVAAGTIKLYSTVDNIRVYSIDFIEN